MKLFNIPFSWYPYSWGLKGKQRKIAEAEYYLDGYELETRLLEIDDEYNEDSSKNDSAVKKAKIDFKYGHINEEKYESILIDNMPESDQKKIATYDTLYKFGHISELEYRKQISTVHNQPFFDFNIDFNEGNLQVEAEYNSLFVEYLRKNGYAGTTDDEIIDFYISDLGRKLSLNEDEELLETNADLDDNIIKVHRADGISEYE